MQKESDFAEDTIQQRTDLKRKRNEFIANMDPNLTQEEKDEMIKAYDINQKAIMAQLQREQEESDRKL